MKIKSIGRKKGRRIISAVVADEKGQIFDLEGFAAVGMENDVLLPLTSENTMAMPYGGELMMLPQRFPIVYDLSLNTIVTLSENPYYPGERIYPVAAFNSPGYVNAYASAHAAEENAQILPLFSYGAVGWGRGAFRSAVIQVDWEKRQDLRYMKLEDVNRGIHRMRKKLPENRLRAHLETCALTYGCPAGKNFFLGRYEAPLPTSRQCNARCLGCISLQPREDLSVSQNRITFTPEPHEIAEVALEHIGKVDRAVVSFGQGCEGDPLLAAHVIEPAIRMIRTETRRGTINLNTNGSLPDVMKKLLAAGLDSIRVSMNSVRKPCYNAYFNPRGYQFEDVMQSIDAALDAGKFVSINYLNCPGFTDTEGEYEAFCDFMARRPINMIQWRNLNYDPIRYLKSMKASGTDHGNIIGMKNLLNVIHEKFPRLKYGYFNPPREKFNNIR